MQRCIYRVYTIHVQFPCASKICGILSVWYNNCKYDVYTVYMNHCRRDVTGLASILYPAYFLYWTEISYHAIYENFNTSFVGKKRESIFEAACLMHVHLPHSLRIYRFFERTKKISVKIM